MSGDAKTEKIIDYLRSNLKTLGEYCNIERNENGIVISLNGLEIDQDSRKGLIASRAMQYVKSPEEVGLEVGYGILSPGNKYASVRPEDQLDSESSGRLNRVLNVVGPIIETPKEGGRNLLVTGRIKIDIETDPNDPKFSIATVTVNPEHLRSLEEIERNIEETGKQELAREKPTFTEPRAVCLLLENLLGVYGRPKDVYDRGTRRQRFSLMVDKDKILTLAQANGMSDIDFITDKVTAEFFPEDRSSKTELIKVTKSESGGHNSYTISFKKAPPGWEVESTPDSEKPKLRRTSGPSGGTNQR